MKTVNLEIEYPNGAVETFTLYTEDDDLVEGLRQLMAVQLRATTHKTTTPRASILDTVKCVKHNIYVTEHDTCPTCAMGRD